VVGREEKKSYRAITYYRHSAQERQANSVEIQRDTVLDFAERHDIEIIDDHEIDKNDITSFILQKIAQSNDMVGREEEKES